MGKSPAKWIKAVLFGKKSTRSHASKARYSSKATNDKGHNVGKDSSSLAVNSPVISEPVLVSTDCNGITPELENGTPSNLDEAVTLPTSQDAEKQGTERPGASNDPEIFREEQAAIRAQAAFRGFLARRAFRALKGIIRLQALVRGHFVRRQAVATLCSMQGIVKLQALARGQKARRSDIGLEINSKFGQRKPVDPKPLNTWKEKLATNSFICKLLSSSPVAMPLQIQYDNAESNSVYSWLERWTSSRFWKSFSQPKKAIDSKSQSKKGNAMETGSGRSKRIVRRTSAGGIDSGPTNIISEPPEKPKRNMKKVSSSAADSRQEHPQSELEKVKRNLRKVSNMTETSDRPEAEIEKPNRSLRKVSNTQSDVPGHVIDESAEKPNRSLRKVSNTQSDVPGHVIDESADKAKKDIALTPEAKPDVESSSKSVAAEAPVDTLLDDRPPAESHPLQSVDIEENLSLMNGELSSKEEQTCYENQKTSKRRASFSAKSEHAENGLQNTPPLPSYMASTESAKAKLRGQNSPRFGSDSVDTRRHSLPSSTTGKVSSNSPRTQRLVQGSGKGFIRSDRSLVSSRDGNERSIQVEWRR